MHILLMSAIFPFVYETVIKTVTPPLTNLTFAESVPSQWFLRLPLDCS